MTIHDIGWKCGNCGDLNKHLELDLEFGKRRETVTCDNCGENQKLEEQERLYEESQIKKVIKRNLDLMESIAEDEEVQDEQQSEVRGRKRQVLQTAKTFGFKQSIVEGEDVNYCLFCGTPNAHSARECEKCGREKWSPEHLDAQPE